MSEWGIALIAAGSAILGSVTTGFFAWRAGHRQAAAAEAAGQAQANALISTVQATLDEQRRARLLDRRRQVYADFLECAHRVDLLQNREAENWTELTRKVTMVELEGLPSVSAAAAAYYLALATAARDGTPGPAPHELHRRYVAAVKAALSEAP
ncbi:hypothetical protein ACFVZW_25265 [Streptomyces sp. NPDC059567]|uniref:hypothetical protein n=1 Tax=Streptomyces sp. NPDC059567 TaxID=3346867 RepID=UPI00369A5F28